MTLIYVLAFVLGGLTGFIIAWNACADRIFRLSCKAEQWRERADHWEYQAKKEADA